jgi:hypothetical protein
VFRARGEDGAGSEAAAGWATAAELAEEFGGLAVDGGAGCVCRVIDDQG